MVPISNDGYAPTESFGLWSLDPFRSLSPCYKASFACSPAREREESRLDANLEGARACTRPRSRSLRRSFIASFLS